MEAFKKIISLREASKISGYNQDYLSFLIREGQIKGLKKGRAWFTTKEELENYLFKKKIKQKELAIPEFFSKKRTKNITLVVLFFLFLIFLFVNFQSKKDISSEKVRSTINTEVEDLKI